MFQVVPMIFPQFHRGCRGTPGRKAVTEALLVSFQVLPQGGGISWRIVRIVLGENQIVVVSKVDIISW